MSENHAYDVVVIGAGIGGASVSYELSQRGLSVLVLEAEERPAYHTTGRSAAFYSTAYGNDAVRAITLASANFYASPPPGFCDYPLLKPSGALYIARENQRSALEILYRTVRPLVPEVSLVDQAFALGKVPQLKPDYVAAALWEPESREIDVAALLQGYIKFARQQGAKFIYNARVQTLSSTSQGWEINSAAGTFHGKAIINSAGAWADQIGSLAGATHISLAPKKRTLCIARAPENMDVRQWPLTLDVDDNFYFKPDGGNILITPADETLSAPCDAFPEEQDVALGIERFQQAMNVEVNHVIRQWAGLRSFVADKSPVVGYDQQASNFFWLAAQGGYGIQMAPALAALAAKLFVGESLPTEVSALGLEERQISPNRFL